MLQDVPVEIHTADSMMPSARDTVRIEEPGIETCRPRSSKAPQQ